MISARDPGRRKRYRQRHPHELFDALTVRVLVEYMGFSVNIHSFRTDSTQSLYTRKLHQIVLHDPLPIPEIQQPHALIGQMSRIARLAEWKVDTRRAEFSLEPEYSGHRTAFSDLEGLLAPNFLDGQFEGFEVWVVERGEPP